MFDFILLALGLGIKHSFDADHLVAVSNLLSRVRSPMHAVKMSFSWAAGHMLTASIVTAAMVLFRQPLLDAMLGRFGLVVGAMLIFLGAVSVTHAILLHSHRHEHNGERHEHLHIHAGKEQTDHEHRHLFRIGIIHGLASNDEILVLLLGSLGVGTVAEGILGVAVFSLGVMAGMVAFGLVFTLPLLAANSAKIARAVNLAVGAASIVYGSAMIIGLA